MRFRRVLFPLVRVCQYSGLCPISVYGSDTNSALSNKRKRFATLTAAICVVQLLLCIYTFTHTNNIFDSSRSRMFVYTNMYVTFTMRVHAIIVLVESFVKRSIQLELFEKIDEIETIFIEKLNRKSNDERLRRRFRHFVIVWIVKFVVFNLIILLAGILTSEWRIVNALAITCAPLYISTLFYAQLMVYLDVVKYNIESINDCLAKLRDAPRFHWTRWNSQPLPATEMIDVPQQLVYLRICYSKTWEASILINSCVRCSLLLGINNDFVFSVANLYSILYLVFKLPFAMTYWRLLVRAMWAGLNVSHVWILSMICEQILEQVSIATRS